MLRYAYYSVISPEGCAGILWKHQKFADQAAQALRFTSKDLLEFGVIDEIIDEPLGGAHRNHHHMALGLKGYLAQTLRDLSKLSPEELLNHRYDRFRRIGVFEEQLTSGAEDGQPVAG